MSKIKSTSSSSPTFKIEDYVSKGTGVIVLGDITSLSFHTLTSKTDIHRYSAFQVKVKAAHTRVFNKYGTESIPEDMMKEAPTKLSFSQLCQLLSGGDAAVPKSLGVGSDVTNSLHPTVEGSFIFWADPDQVKNAGYKEGESVVLRTQGDSIFLQQVQRSDTCNFEGMENQKLLAQISSKTDNYAGEVVHGKDLQGADDDEWDD